MMFTRPAPRPSTDTSPLDYSDDGPGMIGACSVLAVLATTCVVLRFWSKRLVQARWMADDWLALAALVVHHGFMASVFVQIVAGGLGRDIRLVYAENPDSLVIFYKALFAAEITYGFSSPLVKLAILCFYWRIFPTRSIQIGCYVIGSMCIGWMVSIQIVNVIQCRPLMATWYVDMQELPRTECIDIILFFLGNSIFNCIIDLATVLLPIPAVFKLKTSIRKKIGIAAVFLLGGIAFAASLTRTVTKGIMYSEGKVNFTKQNVAPGVVSALEIYAAIIGACLPTMIPVYRKLRYGDVEGSSNQSSKPYSNKDDVQSSKMGENASERTESSSERLCENELARNSVGTRRKHIPIVPQEWQHSQV